MNDHRIDIESLRDNNNQGAACLIRWGAIETYAPVADVRQTAEDLFTCAAYADLIGELLGKGFDAPVVTGMVQAMLRSQGRPHFGATTTLFVLPGGSSARMEGVVLLGRRDLFHRGKADGVLSPGEARQMGRVWLTAAETSDADTLFGGVLERAGWMTATELDALFGLLADIRGGNADMPAARHALEGGTREH